MTEDRLVTDLRQALFIVRVRYGWRALAGYWLISLGAWVGGAKLEFLGSEDT